MIKIAMADDHVMVRSGIRAVLERENKDIQIIAEFSNGKELIDFASQNDADVYLMDISMPLLNGIEATQKLLKMKPTAKVIILSMYDDRISVEKAIKAGAKGFVVKVSDTDTIIKAIEEVISDRFFLCSKVSRYLVEGFLNKTSHKRAKSILTPKEREVLQLIAEGYSSKKIAEEFGLSLNTVHVHRNNIMRKLKIHKQAALIRYALKEGIAHI
ncbi:MAG: response regulator transcription factor [Elusimicrobiota bacterium]|jgi:two-component system NarL family response regulator|nr:response regulator transcription factor [Elusimicrobiota bacterium]